MDQHGKKLEDLHRQASTLYLQGEYGAALQAWRQLLQIDPKDERAREGARLCELLADDEVAGATAPSQQAAADRPADPPAAAPAAEPTAVGFGMGEDLDESLDELDQLLGDGKDRDWMDAAPPQAEGAGAEIDFDLSDVSEAPAPKPTGGAEPAFEMDGSASGQAPAADAQQAAPDGGSADEAFEFNFEGTDRQGATDTTAGGAQEGGPFDFVEAGAQPPEQSAPARPAQTDAKAAAAEELQHRTNELMAEAMEQYERGDRQAALAALSRLSILNENDEAAKTFAAHIQAEIEEAEQTLGAAEGPIPDVVTDVPAPELQAEVESPPPAPAVETDLDLNHQPIDLGDTAEGTGLGLDSAQPAVDAGVPQAQAEPLPDAQDDLLLEPEEAALHSAEAQPKKTRAGSANKWLMIAAAALILIVGGYVALQFVGQGSATAEADPPGSKPLPQLGAPATDPVVDGGATVPPQAPDVPPPDSAPAGSVPAGSVPAAVQELLQRAETELDAGNYAGAVLAYNEALKIDPHNPEIKSRLKDAGELYREQRLALEHREEALEAFNDGDYRNALRLLYRLPADNSEDRQRFERYKRNGWYNMGLQALRSGDCRGARDHLREARQIDPQDGGVLHALELTALCFEDQSQSFFDIVRPLPFRGLED